MEKSGARAQTHVPMGSHDVCACVNRLSASVAGVCVRELHARRKWELDDAPTPILMECWCVFGQDQFRTNVFNRPLRIEFY
jgi:hypothetical protein